MANSQHNVRGAKLIEILGSLRTIDQPNIGNYNITGLAQLAETIGTFGVPEFQFDHLELKTAKEVY